MQRDPWSADRPIVLACLFDALGQIKAARTSCSSAPASAYDALEGAVNEVLSKAVDRHWEAGVAERDRSFFWYACTCSACEQIRKMHGHYGPEFDKLVTTVYGRAWRAWRTDPAGPLDGVSPVAGSGRT